MAQHSPKDDSSDIVVHARHAVFVMLVVCAVVAVSILLRETDRLRRANAEMEAISGLMKHWRDKSSAQSSQLAAIVAGRVPQQDRYTSFKLDVVALNNAARKPFQCTVTLDLSQYFFVPAGSREPVLVATSPGTAGAPPSFKSWEHQVGVTWNVVRQVPTNVLSFSKLWNVLVASKRAAYMRKVIPTAGTLQGYANSSDDDTPYYRIDKSVEIQLDPDPSRPIHTGVLLPRDFAARQVDGENLDAAIWKRKYPDEILDLWAKENVAALTSGKCHNESNKGGSWEGIVTIPVRLKYEEFFDWPLRWVRRAIESKHLAEGTSVNSRSFSDAFPDLHREAKGLERLDLNSLSEWLRTRIDSEGQIAVMGVSFPQDVLRLFGVVLMLAFQAYTTLHLSEVVTRMKLSAPGDPGAFKPWIMLYEGVGARCAAVGSIFAPPVAALVLVVRLAEGGLWVFSVPLWSSIIGLVLSVVLSISSLTRVGELRSKAREHRRSYEQALQKKIMEKA